MEACYSELILVATLHSGVCWTLGRCDRTICSLKNNINTDTDQRFQSICDGEYVLHIKTKSYFDKTSSLCTNVLFQDRESAGKAMQQKFESSHNLSTNDSKALQFRLKCFAVIG